MGDSHAAVLARMSNELKQIKEQLAKLLAMDATRNDPSEVRQALSDIVSVYALVGQLVEVYEVHRVQLESLTTALSQHDAEIKTEWSDLRGLLVQLRELARKHVDGLYNLERAIYGGETRREQARRLGEGNEAGE